MQAKIEALRKKLNDLKTNKELNKPPLDLAEQMNAFIPVCRVTDQSGFVYTQTIFGRFFYATGLTSFKGTTLNLFN